jgi:hypothetical protein
MVGNLFALKAIYDNCLDILVWLCGNIRRKIVKGCPLLPDGLERDDDIPGSYTMLQRATITNKEGLLHTKGGQFLSQSHAIGGTKQGVGNSHPRSPR